MKKVISILTVCLILISLLSVFACADDTALKFNPNGKFTILQIADTQDDMYMAYELPGFIEKAIELANPDLVVFTGDTVENSRIADAGKDAQGWREGVTVKGDYEKTLENTRIACNNVFSIINDKHIPFAVTQGNNDYSSGVSNSDWLDIYSKYEYCLVKDESGDSDGRIDYSLPIYSSDGRRIKFNLYMMDNARSSDPSVQQLQWYVEKSNALKESAGEPVKSFVFEHTPIAETGNLFEKCMPWESRALSGGFAFYKLGSDSDGYADVYQIPGLHSEQFRLWKEQGDVIGAYFGHVHSDGYTGFYDGIELGLTYGCQFSKAGPFGIRVFILDENDISNYENTLYTYSKGKFTAQSGDGSDNMNLWIKFISVFRRLFSFLAA